LKELISKFNAESIDTILHICNYDSKLTENNIDEIIVFLFNIYFFSIKELDFEGENLGATKII